MDLRAVFDDEMRRRIPPPPALRREDRGPLTWIVGPTAFPLDHMVAHSRLRPGEAEGVVAAEVARARAERRGLQWNVYGHDEPSDLAAILERHGLVVESTESILTVPSGDPRHDGRAPAGVELRRLASADEIDSVLAVNEAVWGPSHSAWLRRWFEAAFRGEGDPIAIFVAFAAGRPVGTGWTALHPGRTLAGLYGGTVLPEWRGRGVYRALVSARARAAREAGVPHLVTGANENSGPRLRRMGFTQIATCVELVLAPP